MKIRPGDDSAKLMTQTVLMINYILCHQSVLNVTIPPGDSGAFDQNFCLKVGI